jgi:hypothetical protein
LVENLRFLAKILLLSLEMAVRLLDTLFFKPVEKSAVSGLSRFFDLRIIMEPAKQVGLNRHLNIPLLSFAYCSLAFSSKAQTLDRIEIERGTICMMNQMPEKISKIVVKF